jgi:hypothetical protein
MYAIHFKMKSAGMCVNQDEVHEITGERQLISDLI